MVAREEMHLHAQVRELAHLAQKAGIALVYDQLVLKPEVKHIAQHIDGSRLVFDAVEETNQPPLLCAGVLDGTTAQVGIGKKVYRLHYFTILQFTILQLFAPLGGPQGA
jgi:hypothetical protein